jgi:hypothetical protein
MTPNPFTPQRILCGEVALLWRYGNPVLEYESRPGERGTVLMATDLEEQLALFTAFYSPGQATLSALHEAMSKSATILRWDFRTSRPYTATYFAGPDKLDRTRAAFEERVRCIARLRETNRHEAADFLQEDV